MKRHVRGIGLLAVSLGLLACPQEVPPVATDATAADAGLETDAALDTLTAPDAVPDTQGDVLQVDSGTDAGTDADTPPLADGIAPADADTSSTSDADVALDLTPVDVPDEDTALGDDGGEEDAPGDALVDVADVIVVDAGPGPDEPVIVTAAETDPPTCTENLIVAGAFDMAFSLPAGTWLEGAGGSQVYDPVNGSVLSVPGLEGDVLKAEVIGSQVVLVLTTEDLYAFNGTIAAPSPLGSVVGDPPIRDLVDATENDVMAVWLITDGTLYGWKNGALTAVSVGGVDFSAAAITYGALFQGSPAFWVAAGDQLFALVESEGSIDVWEVLDNVSIDELGSDLDGNLWVLQQGDLFQRSPLGEWTWYTFETPLLGLAAHRKSWMVWLRLETEIWGHFSGQFWSLDSLPMPSFMALGPKESLTAIVDGDVVELVAGSLPDPPVPPMSWVDDIGPFSASKCSLCHGPGQFAHEMASYEQWIDEFPDILGMIQTGQMPLAPVPAVTPLELQHLLDWQAGGFAFD